MKIQKVLKKGSWEKFVLSQKYTSPFLSWSWGEFEKSRGNTFERYGIYKRNKLVGVIPTKVVEAKRGKFLHIRHGPLFDFDSGRIWDEFFVFIKRIAENSKSWFVRMSPLIPKRIETNYSSVFKSLKDSSIHNVDAEMTWVLNIQKTQTELLENMRKNTRYYIKRSKRDGVEVVKGEKEEHFENFWRIYQDTVERQVWEAYSKDYIRKEWEVFRKNNQAQMLIAYYKKKPIAAAIILFYGDQAVYHHSGSLSKYRKIPASYAIQWEAIKLSKSIGKKWYNFWGISPLLKQAGDLKPASGHPWEGLTFFKMGFGGKVRKFIHAKDLPISRKYYLTCLYERFEKWRRGY